MVFSLLLGGGTRQGQWSDAVIQLASLPLLIVALWQIRSNSFSGTTIWPLAIAAATVLLPIAQLVDLPPLLWTALPGREVIVDVYAAVGMAVPWLPISLDPEATRRCALALLPGLAVFLATLCLDDVGRRRLSVLFIAFGVVSVLLGLAQLIGGPNSELRPYPITNVHDSVGLFANRNHYAALLYSLIPFVVAWMVSLRPRDRVARILGMAICLLIYSALLLGLGMARSRAGLAFGAGATLLSLALVGSGSNRTRGYGLTAIAAATLFGIVLVVQFGLAPLLSRFDGGIGDDFRVRTTEFTFAAANSFAPFGSGLGSFEAVYRMFETPDVLLSGYVNHAHNDWAELWLEGGLPAGIIVLAFFVWFIKVAMAIWRKPDDDRTPLNRALARAATITITLLLLHATVDYALRTTTIMVMFAFCCGLLVRPQRGGIQST